MKISHLMYTHDTRRTPRAILRLHNTTLLHANACLELFSQPTNRHILHSRFIHSIVSHAPIVFRLISLPLVNVEAQERTFAQMKQITKATSSNQPNHVITNILIHLKEEGKSKTTNTIEAQENDIGKIARVVGKANNTVIPHAWCRAHPTQYQAHLERISDS